MWRYESSAKFSANVPPNLWLAMDRSRYLIVLDNLCVIAVPSLYHLCTITVPLL